MASSSSLSATPAVAPKLASSSSSSSSAVATPDRRPSMASFPNAPSRAYSPLCLSPYKASSLRSVQSPAVNAQAIAMPSNDAVVPAALDPEVPENRKKDPPPSAMSKEATSEFMTQVTELVKLVDARDIAELQLKQLDCELIIRKKEALPQPPIPAPVVMMHPPPMQVAIPPQHLPPAASPAPSAPASPPPASAPPVLALPAPAKAAKSSLPPLKCPMAGTFYRSPAPGQPPFVKVGDKVNKGQVLCIIEAMKLMNEIEADQSGTIVDILVGDGKPVSADLPLFIIEP